MSLFYVSFLILIRYQPVVTPATVGHKRDAQRIGPLHLLQHEGLYPIVFFGHDAEIQFVVDLQQEFTLQSFCLHALVDVDHRHLDDVGRRTLYGCVDGVTFGKATHGAVM